MYIIMKRNTLLWNIQSLGGQLLLVPVPVQLNAIIRVCYIQQVFFYSQLVCLFVLTKFLVFDECVFLN